MVNYDKVKFYAFESMKKATNSLSYRTHEWATGNIISSDRGLELKKCISKFYTKIKKTTLANESLTGWECGLCQIIDITNEDVCKLLPFLLTAYIFNFPQNEFVTCYLKQLEKNHKKYKHTDDWFCGIEISMDANDNEFIGIGKLLNKQMHNDSRNKEALFRLIQRFQFPKTTHCFNKKGLFNSQMFYIMPQSRAKKQQKYLDSYFAEITYEKGKTFAPFDYVPKNTKYSYAFIINILFTWDYVFYNYINSQTKRQLGTSFACPPDFLLCWILFCESLNLDVEIEDTKTLFNEYSYYHIQTSCRKQIASILKYNFILYDRKKIFG